MDTIGLDNLLEKPDDETVEVVIGLDEDESDTRLKTFCGDDGEIINTTQFNICRVRLTVECLKDLTVGGENWIDFIEPSAQDSEVTWDTEYEKEYN